MGMMKLLPVDDGRRQVAAAASDEPEGRRRLRRRPDHERQEPEQPRSAVRTMGSTTIVEARCRKAAKDETVKAIVLAGRQPRRIGPRQRPHLAANASDRQADRRQHGRRRRQRRLLHLDGAPTTSSPNPVPSPARSASSAARWRLRASTTSLASTPDRSRRGENSGIFSTTHKFSDIGAGRRRTG